MLKPRRTIRVALWSGEEEGLLGSLAYVKQHFGTFENPKPEFARLDCYFNIDSGTGRIRAAPASSDRRKPAAVLRPVFPQFKEWGVAGINVTSSRNTGGTDSTSFNNAGLPGVGSEQDPIEYGALTHHTDLDTYERMIPEDVKEAAVVMHRPCGMWPTVMPWCLGSQRANAGAGRAEVEQQYVSQILARAPYDRRRARLRVGDGAARATTSSP